MKWNKTGPLVLLPEIIPNMAAQTTKRSTENDAILRAVAASSLDALITIDWEGLIVEFSPVAESMFGYKRDEVLGMSVAEVVIPPRLRQAHNDGMNRFHKEGTGPVIGNRIEVPAIRRNGEEFPAELTVVHFDVGNRKLFTAFVRDITVHKRHEEQLQHAKKLAEEASQAKSRFLATMTHELRSPLTTVLGAIDLLMDSKLDPLQERHAQMARSSGESLLALISDILDFSRIESGKIELQLTDLELRPLIDQVKIAGLAKADSKGISMQAFVSDDVPDIISCDPIRLRQVLVNFIDNAIKFTDKGQVSLSVTVLAIDQEAVELQFSVKDTGVGIPQNKADSVFNEFYQIDDSDSTLYSGAGLGLSIVKLIAEKMQAQVGVKSTEGKGSHFWMNLRAAYTQRPDVNAEIPDNRVPEHGISANSNTCLKAQSRVLLAEDAKPNQLIIQTFLEAAGYAVTTVSNGQEAVEAVRNHQFDLILMDLRMPLMDGVDATRIIRSEGNKPEDLCIIALTANALQEDIDRCMEAGMNDYLTKPIRKADFLRKLASYLD